MIIKNIFQKLNLKIVDIGGRGGDFTYLPALTDFSILAPYSNYYSCEPDKVSANTLYGDIKNSNNWKSITIFAEAISSNAMLSKLHITKQPGMSSLLLPNEEVCNKYYNYDAFIVEKIMPIDTIPLDNASRKYKFDDASFFKIDTQGTELDILKSGKILLDNHILGIYVEVEFQKFYTDQPLFTDIDIFLRNKGFSLFNLERVLVRRKNYVKELFSRRELIWGHALYIKDINSILKFNDKERKKILISKLFGIMLSLRYYDFVIYMMKDDKIKNMLLDFWGKDYSNKILQYIHKRSKKIIKKSIKKKSIVKELYKDKSYLDKI